MLTQSECLIPGLTTSAVIITKVFIGVLRCLMGFKYNKQI